MIGSIGKLAGGIGGKSASGIAQGGLGLAGDITGLAKGGKGGGKSKGGGGKAQVIQQVLQALLGAKGGG